VSVKWEGVDNWHDGVVRAYNKENCKHVVSALQHTQGPLATHPGNPHTCLHGVVCLESTAPKYNLTVMVCCLRCSVQVDYDEPTGYPVEFRMGLDAKVKLDLPPGQEPRDASKGHLEHLMRLLLAEAAELSDCAAQDAQMLQPLRKRQYTSSSIRERDC
jgi:hypothetical protein